MKSLTRRLTASLLLTGCLLAGCVNSDVSHTHEEIAQTLSQRMESRSPERTVDAPHTQPDNLPVLSGRLNAADAVKLALANNQDLKIAYLSRGKADGLLMQAYAGVMPVADLSAEAESSSTGKSESSRSTDDVSDDSYSVGVTITQPLWRSGSVAAGLRYAKLYVASSDLTIREQVQSTIRSVLEKYMNVLLEQHLVRVYEESVGVAERLLQTTRNRRQQGTVSDYDVLRAQVEVANTKAAFINEKNALQSAIVSLLQVMGTSQNSQVEFTGELTFSPEAYDLDQASATAEVLRPDLAKAVASLKMAEENIRIAHSAFGPSADAFATGNYSNYAEDEWNDDWTIGAKVSLTLFDGFKRRGKVIEVRAARDQAAETLRNLEEKAHVEVVNALLQLKYADELYQSQKMNIDLAREGLRMLEAGSSRGKNTPVEVLDAQAALTKAMGAYYQAIYAHGLARLSIRSAMGSLSPEEPVDNLIKPSARIPAVP